MRANAMNFSIQAVGEYFREFKEEILDEVMMKIENKAKGYHPLFVRDLLSKVYGVFITILTISLSQSLYHDLKGFLILFF